MARHHTPKERRALVDAWRRSGPTQASYAHHLGISPQPLSRWATHERWPLPAFVEVPMVCERVASEAPISVSMTVGQCQVSFDRLPPASWFAAVLTAVGQP
jgi:hypothetical protein